MNSENTLYWYDYETFGTNPRVDRLVQFAGIRTDEDLNIVGDPLMLYCKPADDFLPHPEASLITGITPQLAVREGVPENEFITQILKEFSQPKTCVVGYNNIRFDDEFTRYSLYRNLLDPYAREWQNGNSRWDLIDVVRLTRALRPAGVIWPTHPDGRPSVRLEDLTQVNELSHESAHDALSDVYATIAVAKLIRDQQPRLYHYAFANRGKQRIASMLNLMAQKPVLHISGMYSSERGNAAIIVPLAMHPTNKNGVIVYDLGHAPDQLIELSSEAIAERIFTPQAMLPEGLERISLKTVHINKCPIIAPLNTLDETSAARLNIDITRCKKHLLQIQKGAALSDKLQKVFSESSFEPYSDPDDKLYGGPFFSRADRTKMEHIHTLSPSDLAGIDDVFEDERLPEMLFRYRARNWPHSLSAQEQTLWQEFRHERLTHADGGRMTLDNYFALIEELRQSDETTPQRDNLLDELECYGKELLKSLP